MNEISKPNELSLDSDSIEVKLVCNGKRCCKVLKDVESAYPKV